MPYDITEVGSGIALPMGLPMRRRKYNGGSGHARAGRGINSEEKNTRASKKIYINKLRKRKLSTTRATFRQINMHNIGAQTFI